MLFTGDLDWVYEDSCLCKEIRSNYIRKYGINHIYAKTILRGIRNNPYGCLIYLDLEYNTIFMNFFATPADEILPLAGWKRTKRRAALPNSID